MTDQKSQCEASNKEWKKANCEALISISTYPVRCCEFMDSKCALIRSSCAVWRQCWMAQSIQDSRLPECIFQAIHGQIFFGESGLQICFLQELECAPEILTGVSKSARITNAMHKYIRTFHPPQHREQLQMMLWVSCRR